MTMSHAGISTESEHQACQSRHRRKGRRKRQESPGTTSNAFPVQLSARAIAVLVRRLPGSTIRVRDGNAVELLAFGGRLSTKALLRIATRCSRSELLAERNVGSGTVAEIERWLTHNNRSFRLDLESLESALERAIGHLEALVDSHDADAPLKAFLAIPYLKRALRIATANA